MQGSLPIKRQNQKKKGQRNPDVGRKTWMLACSALNLKRSAGEPQQDQRDSKKKRCQVSVGNVHDFRWHSHPVLWRKEGGCGEKTVLQLADPQRCPQFSGFPVHGVEKGISGGNQSTHVKVL